MDADCSDGKACNGVEKCTTGTCHAGTPPCSNADPVNCVVTCTEGASAVCGAVQGIDADGDGYRSSSCAAAPGNDCNDSKAAIHPGATEICDGVDNDCNGKIDIADGLKPLGTSAVLWSNALNSSIAYSPTDNVFGVPLSKPDNAASAAPYNTYLFVLDTTNTKTIFPVALTSVANFSGPTAITWGGSDFGIAYGDDNSDLKFRRVTSSGTASAQVSAANDGDYPSLDLLVSLSIARVPGGNWGIVWHEAFQSYHNVLGLTVSAADVPSGIFPIGTAGVRAQIASLNGGFGVAWYESGTGTSAGMSNRTSAFVSSKTQTLSTTAGSTKTVIASNGTVYGVAWADATNLYFRTISDAGAAGCGPAVLPISGFVPSDIVATKNGGFLIVSGSTKIEALDVSSSCVFGTRFTIDADTGTNVHIAGGGGKPYGLAWDDGSLNDAKGVQTRILGANICD